MTAARVALLAIVALAAACAPNAATPSASPSASPTTAPRTAPATATPPPVESSSGSGQVTAFEVLTEIVGWVALRDGAGASLVRTDDGGRTWMRVGIAPIAGVVSLDELRFIDARRGFAVASRAQAPGHETILVTSDGGATWTQSLELDAPVGLPSLRGLVAVDDRHAWVIATPGPCDPAGCVTELRATADAGTTWTTSYRPTGSTVAAVSFADVAHGWLVNAHAVRAGADLLRTADGGSTWTMTFGTDTYSGYLGITSPTPTDVWTLSFDAASCTGSGCARYGLQTSHDGGATWSTLHAVDAGQSWWARPGCGGFLGRPLFVDSSHGFIPMGQGAGAISPENPGGLLVTDDGGKIFRCVRVTPEKASIEIRFANAKVGWAMAFTIDARRSLYRTVDGGLTWQRMTLPRGP